MQKIISELKLKQVRDFLICQGDFKDKFVEQVKEHGASMAAS